LHEILDEKEEHMRERIVEAMARISAIPGAFIDRGVIQGPTSIPVEMQRHPQMWTATDEATVAATIASLRAYWTDVDAWLVPNRLPDDFRFFLEFYGGLAIDQADYFFNIYGFGLSSPYRYESILDGDDSLYEHGWLAIGMLSLKDETQPHYGQLVHFFTDLVGNMRQGCVIAVPTWGCHDLSHEPHALLSDVAAHKGCWTKVADSFTEWLELAAQTRGTFDYIKSKTAA